MAKEISKPKASLFEQIRHTDENGNEYWMARQLSKVLDYTDFRNFTGVIEKARNACENSGNDPLEHIVDANEVLIAGQGAQHSYPSFKLSRYACYLIVQNADPSKEVVAIGQSYFAVQTRIQEIQQMAAYNRLSTEEGRRIFLRNEMSKHNTYLAAAAKSAGVQDGLDYAIFQNHGYMGLYGGFDARGIHKRKGLKKSQQILDHMGSTELAANLFRATQTEEKLLKENTKGKQKANQTHFEIGVKVRRAIKEIGGTMPENLPTAESIKTVQKKLKEAGKKKIDKNNE